MFDKLKTFSALHEQLLREDKPKSEQCQQLLQLYKEIVHTLTDHSALHFNTLFARVSYIAARYQVNRSWAFALQVTRREIHQRSMKDAELIPIASACIQYLLGFIAAEIGPKSEQISLKLPLPPRIPHRRKSGRFKKHFARVIAYEWDHAAHVLSVFDEEEPDRTFLLHYKVTDVNEIFAPTLELALVEIGLPLSLGLGHVETTEEDHLIAAYIVILPDLLLDATTIAQMTPGEGEPSIVNVLNLFMPSDAQMALLTGQLANYMLDELIRDPSQTCKELFIQSFKIFPVEYVRLNDAQLAELYRNIEQHYNVIRDVIDRLFPKEGIDPARCVIEPSYFSPQFGIKGRLDLYHEPEGEDFSSIVELKSSKPFMPNHYGLTDAHYRQTLLYDLMIQSSHGPSHRRKNYVLYSSLELDPLKFAVSVESIQKEILHHRNQWVVLLFRMMDLDHPHDHDLLSGIRQERFPEIKGYMRQNIVRWQEAYDMLGETERRYFSAFTAFITREHMLARIGSDKGDGSGGLAGLWLDSISSKEERYQIFQHLALQSIDKADHQTLITFERTPLTNPLANFRVGDIVILYPFAEKDVQPTRHQLYRGYIVSLDQKVVIIRLRNDQVHMARLKSTTYWNLEHDLLDSSFAGLYQSLWYAMIAAPEQRQTIMGLCAPAISNAHQEFPIPDDLSAQQLQVYREGLQAESIYLLWGPPGTGKTSMMLRSWVQYYYHHTPKRIALLAFTNRAVDEICEVLEREDVGLGEKYIRIGSRASTGAAYKHRLLDQMIEPLENRAEIRSLLESTRIYVATVASMQGKTGLFDLVSFDVSIIDEASQLLEPAILGLMTRFQKNILIGDHMQLPAVSLQSTSMTCVTDQHHGATELALTDLSMSWFERMYSLYHQRGWMHAIGTLFEQGRMHHDIMAVANKYVYRNQLVCVNGVQQVKQLAEVIPIDYPLIQSGRVIYVPSQFDFGETYQKTNRNEVEVVLALVKKWKALIKESGLDWTIGVITPFRAQIAAILHYAHERNVDLKDITVDTVERYQGGARDIIIMSCAVNNTSSLARITSINSDGVDRKLNVALTRAKQQFILTGVEDVLTEEPAYRGFIQMARKMQLSDLVPSRDVTVQA